jgi:hypothetical protein
MLDVAGVAAQQRLQMRLFSAAVPRLPASYILRAGGRDNVLLLFYFPPVIHPVHMPK